MAINISTARGNIRIANSVLVKIIANVAAGCYGVVGLTAGNGGKVLNPNNISSLSKGVKVKSENGKLSVDLHIATTYGINMHTVSDSIRSSVTYQLEHFTGVDVGKFNVHVETVKIVD